MTGALPGVLGDQSVLVAFAASWMFSQQLYLLHDLYGDPPGRRVYQPAAAAAGVTGDVRPYRLRGSFVSLLLWEGRSITYVAAQARHSLRRSHATTPACSPSSRTPISGSLPRTRSVRREILLDAHWTRWTWWRPPKGVS
jgi:hypothetical protein